MLICPQCQFENPNANKFCQKCGASLFHKVCNQCGADVPVSELHCHNCGAECGTVWWAIVEKQGNEGWEQQRQPRGVLLPHGTLRERGSKLPVASGQAEAVQSWDFPPGGTAESVSPLERTAVNKEETIPDAPVIPTTAVSALQLSVGSYLDKEQRYQLLEELSAQNGEWCARVLDCQPYQISLIQTLANQQPGVLTPSVEASEIPSLAKTYLALQSYNHPGIPKIHDAWLDGDLQVLLIEDRSGWQTLVDLWSADNTSMLQILYLCYEMTQLWELLEPLDCHYSLLDLANLRLDEDQTLGLQQLYVKILNQEWASAPLADEAAATPASGKQPVTVKALGRVWQVLFKSSQRTQFASVVQILDDLEQGNIQTITQLRSRLEAVAAELETTSPNFAPMEQENNSVPTILQVDESEDAANQSDDLPTMVLSVQLSSLEDAGQTDVGQQRQHNEDYFGIETKIEKVDLPQHRILQARGLYILCDGMGGHAGGEVASQLAVNTLRQYFQTHWTTNQLPTEDTIREGVYLANQVIYQQNQQDARSGVGRMGTTLVMLLIQGNQAAVVHVGDSRCYRVTRKRGLEQITVDHEVGQREIARGIEPNLAYARPDAYQLTQALGPRDQTTINPDVEFFEINQDHLFALVSDGLSDNDLLETYWQTHLLPFLSSGTSLEAGVRELIELANHYNGHDNITAILVRAKVRPNMGSRE